MSINKKIEFRKAEVSDGDEFYNLNKEFNGVDTNKSRIIESINKGREIIIVAVTDNKLIGFGCGECYETACYDENIGEITELYVQKEHRNQGVGSGIVKTIEDELKKRGVKEVKVITNAENVEAQSTYAKCNYSKKDWIVLTKEI